MQAPRSVYGLLCVEWQGEIDLITIPPRDHDRSLNTTPSCS